MDLLFLKYDFAREMNKYSFSWQELLFALENKILNGEDIINYAIYVLNEGVSGYDYILELATLDSNDDIMPCMHSLIQLEEQIDLVEIKGKWQYLILKWLYENRNIISNVLEIVEEIYEIFNYPSDIVSFVRYMPSEIGDLGSPELNREQLFKNWRKYLEYYEENILICNN